MYLKCSECPFWKVVGIDPELGEEKYDCSVSTLEEADAIGDEMWCQHRYDAAENIELD